MIGIPNKSASSAAPEDRSREILNAFRRLVRILRVSERHCRRTIGISAAQTFVLQKLGDAPAASLNALAERTATDISSVSVVAAKLVRRGFVRRTRSEQDRRVVELEITDAGRAALDRASTTPQDLLVDAVRRLGRTEQKTLADLLERLVEQVDTQSEAAMFFEEKP